MISSICWFGGYHSKQYRRIGATERGIFFTQIVLLLVVRKEEHFVLLHISIIYIIWFSVDFFIVDSFSSHQRGIWSALPLSSSLIVLINIQPSLFRDLSNVLVKVHDECKTEATLLDIRKVSGRSGEGVGPRVSMHWQMAGGRRKLPWTLLLFYSEFAPVPFNRRREVGRVSGLFKPRENLCLYGSFNTVPRHTKKMKRILLFMHFPSSPVVAFSRMTSQMDAKWTIPTH